MCRTASFFKCCCFAVALFLRELLLRDLGAKLWDPGKGARAATFSRKDVAFTSQRIPALKVTDEHESQRSATNI